MLPRRWGTNITFLECARARACVYAPLARARVCVCVGRDRTRAALSLHTHKLMPPARACARSRLRIANIYAPFDVGFLSAHHLGASSYNYDYNGYADSVQNAQTNTK